MTIPTTDEMDGIFTEEDKKNRYNAYIQCVQCYKWTFVIGTPETYGMLSSHATCEHCGSSQMDSRSVISKRTFDPVKSAKRRPGVQKKEKE